MKFEAKVKYEKITPINGKFVTVSESYLVKDAETFSDAEAQTLAHMAQITEATVIPAIKISDVEDIIGNEYVADLKEAEGGDWYYKAKVITTVIDEVSVKEKQIAVVLLVEADTIRAAMAECNTWMSSSIVDCELVSISKTKIVDVI